MAADAERYDWERGQDVVLYWRSDGKNWAREASFEKVRRVLDGCACIAFGPYELQYDGQGANVSGPGVLKYTQIRPVTDQVRSEVAAAQNRQSTCMHW